MFAEHEPRRLLLLQVALAAIVASGCTRAPSTKPAAGEAASAPPPAEAPKGAEDGGHRVASGDAGPPAPPQQIDPDGNDEPEDPGTGSAPAHAHFEKVGTPPLALTRVCDLTPLGDALYLAHANEPLGTDGATLTRYRPSDAKRKLAVAFDWNRPGEPTKGGGAGQGFVRIRNIGGRLFVPDADPPYGGLGQAEWGTEGYVFVSDRSGAFPPARAPHFRPPAPPDLTRDDGRGGAGVLPRAYHDLDVIKYRGAIYVSTGSVPPKEQAWRGPSPGALHRGNDDGSRFTYDVDYPFPYQNGVWRLTYMVRFKDRLYAGIQDYDGRDPNDYLYFAPAPSATHLGREDEHPVRVTGSGAAGTLRWWVDTKPEQHRLYWIAWSRDDGIVLRVTTDGDSWTAIPMPDGAGRPTDVTRFRDAVVVLTERGLYRLDDAGARVLPAPIATIATVATAGGREKPEKNEKRSPFDITDFFCAAPLAVFQNDLYAGGQRGGSLFVLTADP